MTAPETRQPTLQSTDDRQLSPTDQRRKLIGRKVVWAQFADNKHSPLGSDNPALLLHKRAEVEANRTACQLLDLHLDLVATYEKAQAVKDTDPLQAQALMQQARALGNQGESLHRTYETATQAHLATMVHVLAVAVAHKAQQVAVRKVAEVLYAVKVITGADTDTQAPAHLRTFTPHSEAPQIASNHASTAPPASVANKTLDRHANYAHKGVVLTP
jgi:hypothetical protein